MDVVPIPQLQDNYAYLIIDRSAGEAAIVDCAEAGPVLDEVQKQGVRLTGILATHHHYDHVGGNDDLCGTVADLQVYGSDEDAPRIPRITRHLRDGDRLSVGRLGARVIFIPAHTSGHVAYYFADENAVFTGDTLFAAGCGRLFEGDAAQMMASLGRLAVLPDETKVYCGHEYTQKNLEFAVSLEPGNRAATDKLAAVRELRRAGRPTVPSTIREEKATNPFLRTHSAELARSVRTRVPSVPPNDPVALFAAVRALKDRF